MMGAKGKIVGAAVLVAVGFALPYVTSNYYVTLASLVLASALLATSINMLAGDAGLVSLGHAGIAAASGYGLAWSTSHGLGLGTGLAIAAGMTVLMSAVFGLLSMRTKGVFFLMVTLAAGMICYGIAYRWSSVTGGDNGLTGIRRPPFIGAYWQFYFFVLVVFLSITAAVIVISRSPFGLALRGIRDSETRMRSLGYNTVAYKFVAMMLSGLVAGVAGVLLVWQSEFVSPTIGDFLASALALIMVVLGGLGTFSGPLVGAGIVVLMQQVVSTHVERWPTVLGLLFIASVILAPQGLVGGVRDLISKRWARPGRTSPAPTEPSHSPTEPSPIEK
jgi:branched-chain amino acid transport system permease protein